ncbi:MAG: TlpA family protein disulfide reductase [Luteibaculaceae bacterium]
MKSLKFTGFLLVALFVGYMVTTAQRVADAPTMPKIGEKAPEIVLPGVDGKELKLSSLKGKVVLIDFWASWCGPCRRENPNVVRSYEKYKSAKFKNGKGYEIFNVSLDRDKAAWLKGIEQDQLNWKYHVSDLKFWNSEAAQLYGIRSIPANFLIDGEGTIIGVNLRGAALDKALDEILVSF